MIFKSVFIFASFAFSRQLCPERYTEAFESALRDSIRSYLRDKQSSLSPCSPIFTGRPICSKSRDGGKLCQIFCEPFRPESDPFSDTICGVFVEYKIQEIENNRGELGMHRLPPRRSLVLGRVTTSLCT
ncbi:Oidioi.mRNA.OKI2018_I69.chr1.g1926.t1.cds [Oikopleura dioica]|uniref:Oidioi.mRNA.OKI2018_I69.chr1.g1926.t1.cds n=1 Tax=Oikopleura dioica TaxID=34765 RepID=A0ABN7STP8_OIKDI|nr:Oidioi.mRNA.OKI2018_I69.chr1.g1926.t1.cds [Oikopleura dioica]